MVNAHKAALKRLWKDRCTVYGKQKTTNPETGITGFAEAVLWEDLPCKLSFQTLAAAAGDPVASVSQSVKLFLYPDPAIPAGCKIVVTRPDGRQYTYAQSGEPGRFTNHQEILLVPMQRYA